MNVLEKSIKKLLSQTITKNQYVSADEVNDIKFEQSDQKENLTMININNNVSIEEISLDLQHQNRRYAQSLIIKE